MSERIQYRNNSRSSHKMPAPLRVAALQFVLEIIRHPDFRDVDAIVRQYDFTQTQLREIYLTLVTHPRYKHFNYQIGANIIAGHLNIISRLVGVAS